MSQLLFRLSKRSSRSNVLIHNSVRLFSTSPYLILGIFGEDKPGGGGVGDILLFDAATEELVKVRDKIVPEEIYSSKLMGASNGWQFFSDRFPDNNSVKITDLLNPLASKSNTKIIPLPRLTSMMYGQTNVVWNVAMSSSSPHQDNEEEDCVVAIKFLGRQLSMCRPGRDHEWTNKLIPFVCSQDSNLMFSKRDQRFYLPAPGGNYLCSWDLHLDNDPKFNELVFRNIPELPQSSWELLDSYFREDHWVESPCGQSFLVKWYSRVPLLQCPEPILMVFREDQVTEDGTKHMCYTEDIGDLCIFLSKSEPFCVVASSCPGLKPGSIYLMGSSFAVFDITTGTPRPLQPPIGSPKSVPFLPYWLPPFSV